MWMSRIDLIRQIFVFCLVSAAEIQAETTVFRRLEPQSTTTGPKNRPVDHANTDQLKNRGRNQPIPAFWQPTTSMQRRLQPDRAEPSQSPSIPIEVTFSPSKSTPTLLPTQFVSTVAPSLPPLTSNPSSSPTVAPFTQFPTLLPTTPRPSFSPTAAPSTQSPTFLPTTLSPTFVPSSEPSLLPSFSPSAVPSTDQPSTQPSHVPTQSPQPTATPSAAPSLTPSSLPTTSIQPSASPTISSQPTVDPFGVDISDEINEDGDREIQATCRQPIPEEAQSVITQLIRYDYILNIQNNSVVSIILEDIEVAISKAMTNDFLDCQFEDLDADFLVHGHNSAPSDRIASGCLLEEQIPGGTCYTISGEFSAEIFDYKVDFNRRRRHLQQVETQIANPNVAKAFSTALDNVFSTPGIGGANVLGTTFLGITNEVPPPPPSPRNRTPAIVGGVLGGLLGAAILIYVGILFAKKQAQKADKSYYQEAMDAVDSDIDKEETTIPSDVKPKPVTIVNEEEDLDEEAEEPLPQLPVIEEFDVTDTSGEVQFIEVPVSPSRTERMLEETKRELGPSSYESPARRRDYDVKDTVQL